MEVVYIGGRWHRKVFGVLDLLKADVPHASLLAQVCQITHAPGSEPQRVFHRELSLLKEA